MTKTSRVQMVPPTRLLVSGRQDSTTRNYARRPGGTDDWLFVYTEAGRAYFRFPGGEFFACAHDAILIRPGVAHDYGLDEAQGYWKNIWTHFLPRPDCIDWLQWPELAPGLMRLRLERPVRDKVRAELLAMDRIARSAHRRHEELAINALERALLLCDGVNPRYAESHRDPRIRKAVDQLCAAPEAAVTLSTLARSSGLSRSRLAELFRRDMGVAPMEFLERQRLRRAHDLLVYTSLGLAEIAAQCGFSSPFYLSLRFKKHFGASPKHYRARRC
jgi:AraC family transcriptional regulator of arabinose operon